MHHEEVAGQPKQKKSSDDKKSTFTIKAKSIPVTRRSVAASTGSVRERWLELIYKEIKRPLPCQMVFVLKPLIQMQQNQVDSDEAYKRKSRLVTCGNFEAWGEHSTTDTKP